MVSTYLIIFINNIKLFMNPYSLEMNLKLKKENPNLTELFIARAKFFHMKF